MRKKKQEKQTMSDAMREAFERTFPLPEKCEYYDAIDEYCWTNTGTAHPHNEKWEAWQAALEHAGRRVSESEYSQGVAADGAAILKDGQPMTIEEILSELRQPPAPAVRKVTQAMCEAGGRALWESESHPLLQMRGYPTEWEVLSDNIKSGLRRKARLVLKAAMLNSTPEPPEGDTASQG